MVCVDSKILSSIIIEVVGVREVEGGRVPPTCESSKQVFRAGQRVLVDIQNGIDSHLVIPTNAYLTVSLGHRHDRCCPLAVVHLLENPGFL